MLKLILDTNLFKRKELKHLEDYEFSKTFEFLYELISKGKIDDVEICVDQMALLEYIEQVGLWYEEKIVKEYNKIFEAIHLFYPIQKMYFNSKEDFIETYKSELFQNLQQRNIKIIETIPESQNGGVSLVKIIEKTIKNIAPFDKSHNKDLKDAFISETIDCKAEKDEENLYLFITLNGDDFKDNVILIPNYKIEIINQNEEILQIFNIIKKYGSHIDDGIYYNELLKNPRFDRDIKQFVETYILNEDYYYSVPTIQKSNDLYKKTYDISEDNILTIYFYLLDDIIEHKCGIEYDLTNKKPKIKRKFINYFDDNNEEVCFDEF